MTKEMIIRLKKIRLNTLEHRGDKNIKSHGVVRKIKRQIRNLEK